MLAGWGGGGREGRSEIKGASEPVEGAGPSAGTPHRQRQDGAPWLGLEVLPLLLQEGMKELAEQ